MKDGGYIKFYRQIREWRHWPDNRPDKVFTTLEAWIDLLLSAAYKPHKRSNGTTTFWVERGELVASVRYLARRWHWSRGRTQRYLADLIFDQEVGRLVGHHPDHLTIVKYEAYQGMRDGVGTPMDTPMDTAVGQIKESKKVKKVKQHVVSAADLEELRLAWNAVADRCGFRLCRRIPPSGRRHKDANARLKDPQWRQDYPAALERLKPTPFLTGGGDRGWIATFDWLCRCNTVDQILEGQYDHEQGRTTTGRGRGGVAETSKNPKDPYGYK